ncbi:MAG: DUF1624 domain-containing protein [Solirubrobacteraceae bacterium]|nr:DUF1624 domain-containing protein [Solirubrobacteraceae bacterium]
MDDHRVRLWEIDALRTFAIVLMVIYHVAYDVNLLAPQASIDPFNGAWRGLQVVTGSLFLGVVGISFWLSHSRGVSRGLSGIALWRSHVPRAAEVVAAAALVSVATFVALGSEDVVRFGILHLIAVLMLVVLPLAARLGTWNVLLGAAVIAIGLSMDVRSDAPGALVLGFIPPEKGVDWYPLLPWAGCALIGLAAGAALYPGGRRGALLSGLPATTEIGERAGGPGRHSLAIYLVHQPVLIALITGGLLLAGAEVGSL